MSTIIFPSPLFGPVHSRRLGISLGINVCPGDGKICSFDCIYCEIGFNADTRPHQKMPSRGLIRTMLREKLEEMKAEGKLPDTLTFSGNGEPTGHPEFSEIVDDVLKLRDEYCPKAKVSVLTNAFLITRQPIFDALLKVDNAELKLDTVDEEYIERVDRPNAALHLDKILEAMERFGNRAIIQTMFLHGSFDGWTQLKRSDRDLSRSIRLTAIPRRMTCRKQRMKSLTRSLNVSGPGASPARSRTSAAALLRY